MEKTQTTNQDQNNTDIQVPVLPRKAVKISELLANVQHEASVLDVVDAADESKSHIEDIAWISKFEEYDNSIKSNFAYLAQRDKIVSDPTIEVDEVKIFTVKGDQKWNYEETMVVGVVGDKYYDEWANSGKFPYSKYCTDKNPGKLRTDVIYGLEDSDTLKLYVAKSNAQSSIVEVYTRDNSSAASDMMVNGLKLVSRTASAAFAVPDMIYDFPETVKYYKDTDFIVDIDTLLDNGMPSDSSNRFILDGGNMYRWYNIKMPPHLICTNGKVVCKNAELLHDITRPGGEQRIFRNVTAGNMLTLQGAQGLYSYEFNVMDFIDPKCDYSAINSALSINATNVLKRIFDVVYDYRNPNGNRFVIRFPENQYGNAPYFLTEPLVIPHGVTVDFGGARLFVGYEGKMVDHEGTYFYASDTKSVISFGHNPVYPILVTAQIRNVEIVLLNITREKVDKVIDLTYFSGILENVRINLGGATDIVALWQPYGTPWITYSDMKIIRRCIIENFGWRVDTPTVIFCQGDGCVIEQSILGFVTIIGGNSYTIRGCLNDKYLICDSSVDFTASYWEIGQFEILNSEVTFGCCRLYACNNLADNLGSELARNYLGPWFSVDTADSYKRLKKIINEQSLNIDNFKCAIKVIKDDEDNGDNGDNINNNDVACRVYERPSTVEFRPTMKVQTVFWGYAQPWSGPLFKVEGYPRIIGLENVASVGTMYLNNASVSTGANTLSGLLATGAASIPLVNGDFYDWRTSVKVPADVDIVTGVDQSRVDVETICIRRSGLEWGSRQSIYDIRAIFELDRGRRLYSQVYECDTVIGFGDKEMPRISVYVSYSNDEDAPRNLKTILLFKYRTADGERLYMARNHFKEVSHATLVNVGSSDIKFKDEKMVDVGEFGFVKRVGLTPDVMIPISDDATGFIAGLEYNTEELQDYFNSQNPDITCNSGEDVDVPGCDGLCYGHACLCDNKGNLVPEVKDCVFMYHDAQYYNECTRLDLVGDKNVRAYVNEVPTFGQWVDGDEVVIDSLQEVYRYYGDCWHQII